jgi:hypothetical protein
MIQAFLQVGCISNALAELPANELTQRLARFFDRPFFPWKKLVIGFSLAEFALENWLLFRQYRVLQKTKVPKALDKEIEQNTFDKSQVRIPSADKHDGMRGRLIG